MPRDLPVGNGSLLVNFDRFYTLRDFYYPHVGQENHTDGHPNRFGVWVDGDFAWMHDDSWQRDLRFETDSLVTRVTCRNERLGIELICADCVDVGRDIYFKRVEVRDLRGRARKVRLFQQIDLHLWGNSVGDTAFYDPDAHTLVAYKGRRYLIMGAKASGSDGLTRWAAGKKGTGGMEGTWRDAEDGELGGNPIAQGSVDCVGGVDLSVPAGGSAFAWFWIIACQRYGDGRQLHELVMSRGPESFISRTRDYWRLWVNRAESTRFDSLPKPVLELYKRSLLVVRTQIDKDGAIIAANDADILQFGRDTYSYMWPRDGALVAHALIRAGHSRVARRFFEFCAEVILREGYLLHKYNPDGSAGSSWHPWVGLDGTRILPIQEDETALVLWALYAHYLAFKDVEFISDMYRPLVITAADFLCSFREPHTGLPAPSYDLWEERHGISTFTTAAVIAGLDAAGNLVEAFGDRELARKYRKEAGVMREAAKQYLYDADRGHFSRMINVRADGTIDRDNNLDACMFAISQFGMLPPDDPQLVSTFEALEKRLWCKTEVGGMARYENDYYQQVRHDVDTVPGNPWFICTLWLADWHATRATNLEELKSSLDLLTWVAEHALPSGVLAEQVHPDTGEPLSVSPLTWSHAAFVESVEHYLARQEALSNLVTVPIDQVVNPASIEPTMPIAAP